MDTIEIIKHPIISMVWSSSGLCFWYFDW